MKRFENYYFEYVVLTFQTLRTIYNLEAEIKGKMNICSQGQYFMILLSLIVNLNDFHCIFPQATICPNIAKNNQSQQVRTPARRHV